MDIFQFYAHVIATFKQLTRNFSHIRAQDIQGHVNVQHEDQKYWSKPLIQINPNGDVKNMVNQSPLGNWCADIFRTEINAHILGISLSLHEHRTQTFACVREGAIMF